MTVACQDAGGEFWWSAFWSVPDVAAAAAQLRFDQWHCWLMRRVLAIGLLIDSLIAFQTEHDLQRNTEEARGRTDFGTWRFSYCQKSLLRWKHESSRDLFVFVLFPLSEASATSRGQGFSTQVWLGCYQFPTTSWLCGQHAGRARVRKPNVRCCTRFVQGQGKNRELSEL